MPENLSGSATSPSGPAAGSNAVPAGMDPAEARLFGMLTQQEQTATPQPETPASPPAQGGPEDTTPPTGAESPGQDDLQSAETPPGTEPEGGSENPSQPDAELTSALQGLDSAQKSRLLDILKDVQSGKMDWGEIKRGHRLSAQLDEMRQKLEDLEGKARNGAENGHSPKVEIPEAVAKLASQEEVDTKRFEWRRTIRFVDKFLRNNPEGGLIEGRQYTPDELIAQKEQLEDQMDALPVRERQIEVQRGFNQQQQVARQQTLKDFPFLGDPDHPDTKAVRERLKAAPFLSNFHSPEAAALIWHKGEQWVNQFLQARNAPKNGAAPRPVAGKVPVGKPHAAGGGVQPRATGQVTTKAALDRLHREGSQESLAALISAAGM